jgi:hypothetical protein
MASVTSTGLYFKIGKDDAMLDPAGKSLGVASIRDRAMVRRLRTSLLHILFGLYNIQKGMIFSDMTR